MKGLNNLVNTCYFNSCLQCLLHTEYLTNYFLNYPYSGDCKFTLEYSNIVKVFWSLEGTVIDTKNILKCFREYFNNFNNSLEHDSQECLLGILDLLHKGTRNIKINILDEPTNSIWSKKNTSIVKSIFYGQVSKSVLYPGGKSQTFENFSNFLLFPQKNNMNLGAIVKESFDDVVLSDYIDDNGKRHHCSVLRTETEHVPPVCVFCFNMYIRKVVVSVPEELIINGRKYELYALCQHMGNRNGGHYISYTKVEGDWWLKDDEVAIKKEPKLTNYFYFCMFRQTPLS